MRRAIAIGAGLGLAFGLSGAATADDEFGEDISPRTTTTTTPTVTRVEAEPSYQFDEGYPESDYRDEGKDVRNLQPQENPLKGLRWAEDMGDSADERANDR